MPGAGTFHWHRGQLPLSQPGWELAWLPPTGCWSWIPAVSTLLRALGMCPSLPLGGWAAGNSCCHLQHQQLVYNTHLMVRGNNHSCSRQKFQNKRPLTWTPVCSSSLTPPLLTPYPWIIINTIITTPSLYSLNFHHMHIWQPCYCQTNILKGKTPSTASAYPRQRGSPATLLSCIMETINCCTHQLPVNTLSMQAPLQKAEKKKCVRKIGRENDYLHL